MRRYILKKMRFNPATQNWGWATDTEFGTTAMMEEQADILNRLLREVDCMFVLKEEER